MEKACDICPYRPTPGDMPCDPTDLAQKQLELANPFAATAVVKCVLGRLKDADRRQDGTVPVASSAAPRIHRTSQARPSPDVVRQANRAEERRSFTERLIALGDRNATAPLESVLEILGGFAQALPDRRQTYNGKTIVGELSDDMSHDFGFVKVARRADGRPTLVRLSTDSWIDLFGGVDLIGKLDQVWQSVLSVPNKIPQRPANVAFFVKRGESQNRRYTFGYSMILAPLKAKHEPRHAAGTFLIDLSPKEAKAIWAILGKKEYPARRIVDSLVGKTALWAALHEELGAYNDTGAEVPRIGARAYPTDKLFVLTFSSDILPYYQGASARFRSEYGQRGLDNSLGDFILLKQGIGRAFYSASQRLGEAVDERLPGLKIMNRRRQDGYVIQELENDVEKELFTIRGRVVDFKRR